MFLTGHEGRGETGGGGGATAGMATGRPRRNVALRHGRGRGNSPSTVAATVAVLAGEEAVGQRVMDEGRPPDVLAGEEAEDRPPEVLADEDEESDPQGLPRGAR